MILPHLNPALNKQERSMPLNFAQTVCTTADKLTMPALCQLRARKHLSSRTVFDRKPQTAHTHKHGCSADDGNTFYSSKKTHFNASFLFCEWRPLTFQSVLKFYLWVTAHFNVFLFSVSKVRNDYAYRHAFDKVLIHKSTKRNAV